MCRFHCGGIGGLFTSEALRDDKIRRKHLQASVLYEYFRHVEAPEAKTNEDMQAEDMQAETHKVYAAKFEALIVCQRLRL